MSNIVSDDVSAFKERTLESNYSVIFMDATHIPLKRQTVSKEAVYIVIGIRLDGTKEVLGFTIAQLNLLIFGGGTSRLKRP